MEKLTAEEGEVLLKIARTSIENSILNKKNFEIKNIPEKLMKNRGVFVTIYVNGKLRGCIGYSKPQMKLLEATVRAASSAAFADTRFKRVSKEDLKKMKLEVTVLTPPEEIKVKKREELLKEVEVGKHGLIAEYGPYSGLLLPQVAADEKWDAETFLGQTCWKAGLSPADWLNPKVRFYKFEGQIFKEN